jgi:N-acetylglucosaminyl-diphospho-decaprenol L-rhamnosyltransferase
MNNLNTPLLSILVVSYNTKNLTLECIASIFEQTRITPFELIVWDNASTDGSVEAIRGVAGGKMRFIESKRNIGFAAANNRAAEMATGDRLLLINPDTIVLNGAIDFLVSFSDKFPSGGIWGGRTLFKDGSLNPSSCWGRQTVWSLFCQAAGLSVVFRGTDTFNPEGIGGWNREGTRAVDIVSGCFLMISRKLWVNLGGFREEFFMYGEEADLCLRAHKLGAHPLVTSEATIVHYGGASDRVFADKVVRLLKAKRLLIDMHFGPSTQRIGRCLLFLWPVRRYLTHALLAVIGRSASIDSRDAWLEAVKRYRDWW